MAMKKKAPSRGGASDKSKKADSARQSLVARSYATEYYLDPTPAQAAKGSDRGAKMKADNAKKKALLGRQTSDASGSSTTRVYRGEAPNRIKNVGAGVGRSEQRGIDQKKRANAKKAANAKKVAKGKK
jgi:hypothetical protein